MPSSHLILCRPLLLLPPIPPSVRVFSNESPLPVRWPKYWSFSFSIIPSKEIPGQISFRMDCLLSCNSGSWSPNKRFYSRMNLQGVTLDENSQFQRSHIVWFHLYEISRVSESSVDTVSRQWFSRDWRQRGVGSGCLMNTRSPFRFIKCFRPR